MEYDAREIANFILDHADRRGVNITHLQLQKLLFFAHAWHLGSRKSRLIGQKFEAWQYGPVLRVVFDQLKSNGDKNINSRLMRVNKNSGKHEIARREIIEETKKFLEDITDYYLQFSASELVQMSHEKGGPWEKVWITSGKDAGVGMYIDDESITSWIRHRGGGVRSITH
jgi:uncharacterized phage-associated protein